MMRSAAGTPEVKVMGYANFPLTATEMVGGVRTNSVVLTARALIENSVLGTGRVLWTVRSLEMESVSLALIAL